MGQKLVPKEPENGPLKSLRFLMRLPWGLSHFDGFAAANQRCLWRGTCASPPAQVSSFLVVALPPGLEDPVQ